jgi:hypothetical protein
MSCDIGVSILKPMSKPSHPISPHAGFKDADFPGEGPGVRSELREALNTLNERMLQAKQALEATHRLLDRYSPHSVPNNSDARREQLNSAAPIQRPSASS